MRRIVISRVKILLFVFVVFFIGLMVIWFKTEHKERREKVYCLLGEIFLSKKRPLPKAHKVSVSIRGAVDRPGKYLLPKGATLRELLLYSQLKDGADTKNINMNRKLADGESIVIPTKRAWLKKQVESIGIGKAPSPSYLIKPFEIYELNEEPKKK